MDIKQDYSIEIYGSGQLGSSLYTTLNKNGFRDMQIFDRASSTVLFPSRIHVDMEVLQTRKPIIRCLALPDSVLDDVWLDSPLVRDDDVWIHFAGRKAALEPPEQQACLSFVIHPVASLEPGQAWKPGLYVTTDASSRSQSTNAHTWLDAFCSAIQLTTVPRPHDLGVYHAACTLAGSLPFSILDAATDTLHKSGMPYDIAATVAVQLQQSVLDKFRGAPGLKHVSGAVRRKDQNAIRLHLDALSEEDIRQLYSAMTEYILKRL